MTHSPSDPLLRQLAGTTPNAPEAIYSASVRARCHAALARQHRRREVSAAPRADRGGLVEVAAASGFALLYVSLVIQRALAIYFFL